MFKVNKIEKVYKSNIPITVRFPEETYTKLKSISVETNVSFNSVVISAINYALNDMD